MKTLVEIRKSLYYFLVGVSVKNEGVVKLSFPQMLFQYKSRLVGINLLSEILVQI